MFIPNKSKPHLVKDTTTFTDAYVAGTVVTLDEHNYIGIQFTYTKGDETTVQIKIEDSIDNGDSFGEQAASSTSSGTVELRQAVYQLTAANYTGTTTISFSVTPLKADQVKISVKATGGTPDGTYKVTAITGFV